MTGHVRNRGKTWAYVADVGRDPVTDKRLQTTKGGFRTEKDARHALVDVLGAVKADTFVADTDSPLRAFLAEWLDALQTQDLAASTLHSVPPTSSSTSCPGSGESRSGRSTPECSTGCMRSCRRTVPAVTGAPAG